MSRQTRSAASLAAALLGLAALPAPGEAQQTFRACYVPQVGAMYLLDLPGLPTECLSEEHEVIEWTEGGGAGGPVDTDDLVDGAVTGPKLATGAVGSMQIADGQVREADIGVEAVSSDHIQFGAVQSADIAIGAVQDYHVADGAVGSNELALRSVTGAHLDLQMAEATGLAVEQAHLSVARTVLCGDGLVAISGGWSVQEGEVFMRESYRSAPGEWTFRAANVGSETGRFTLHVICADLD